MRREDTEKRRKRNTNVALISGPCTHGTEIYATFVFSSLWNYLRVSVSQAKRVVNDAQGMCQGIFQFSNQNGSWHGQESAGKKSGNNSQFVGLQNGANVDENLSWHFSPKAGQVEIRKSERPLIHLFKQAKRHQDICRNPLKT